MQLRETLGKTMRPDLMQLCTDQGIPRCSNKRKEELIDLLVLNTQYTQYIKNQVHSAGSGRRRPARLCGLCLVAPYFADSVHDETRFDSNGKGTL